MLSTLIIILVVIFLGLVASFIPIGNENSTVRRLPWITFSIIALNVVIFYVTFPVVAGQQDEMMKIGDAMEQFCASIRSCWPTKASGRSCPKQE